MKHFLFACFCALMSLAYAAEFVQIDGVENSYKVSSELYRSGQPTPRGFTALQAHGIRSVLNLRAYHRDTRKARHTQLYLVAYPVSSSKMTAADVENCLAVIANSPKPVLVHCWHGSNRTGIVVAAYRIVYQNWSVADAEKELCDERYGFRPFWYSNLLTLLRETDWDAMRKRLKTR